MKKIPKNTRTHEEINASEIRYRRLFETAQEGVLILDAGTGSITDINPYLIKMLEYTKEEFIGKKLWEIGPFKDILKSKISFKELQKKEYIRYDNLPLETKNGKHKEYEFISNVYQQGDRKVIQCNIRDNSVRKLEEELRLKLERQKDVDQQKKDVDQQKENIDQQKKDIDQQKKDVDQQKKDVVQQRKDINQQLQQQEAEQLKIFNQQLQNQYSVLCGIINSTVEPIFSLDRNYCYTSFNTSHKNVMKAIYNRDIQLGRPIYEYQIKEDWEKAKKNIDCALSGETISEDAYSGEETLARVYFIVSHYPIKNERNEVIGVTIFAKDITDRKKLEEEKIQAQLRQSQKMESIGTLAGGIVHDFNNLLTPIKGYAELAMTDMDKTNPIYDDLNEISSVADKAASLTQQLMLFSRNQPVCVINLNLNKIIEKMSKMLKRIIGEDIEIKIDLSPDLWNINADESRIEQIIMNLTVNAHDAMPNGGTLTVKTENVTLGEEQYIDIPESYPGRFVRLSIQDNGKGMSNEVVQRIFEPFFTTKGIGKGTGLGLSVAYGIVKQHNGWINVYSEQGKGTIFKIHLPAVLDKKETVIQKEVKYRDVTGHGERILVVEDEQAIRDFISKVLLKNGYVAFLTGNVKEALEIYKKEKGKFHLIISDVVLPDKTGIELVKQILLDNPKQKVIFSSGYLDDKSQWEMIQQKGFKFLQKPYELNELLSAIKEVLDKDK